jgi:hypothetical protein
LKLKVAKLAIRNLILRGSALSRLADQRTDFPRGWESHDAEISACSPERMVKLAAQEHWLYVQKQKEKEPKGPDFLLAGGCQMRARLFSRTYFA